MQFSPSFVVFLSLFGLAFGYWRFGNVRELPQQLLPLPTLALHGKEASSLCFKEPHTSQSQSLTWVHVGSLQIDPDSQEFRLLAPLFVSVLCHVTSSNRRG